MGSGRQTYFCLSSPFKFVVTHHTASWSDYKIANVEFLIHYNTNFFCWSSMRHTSIKLCFCSVLTTFHSSLGVPAPFNFLVTCASTPHPAQTMEQNSQCEIFVALNAIFTFWSSMQHTSMKLCFCSVLPIFSFFTRCSSCSTCENQRSQKNEIIC